jgi:hypothetical protein
MKLTRMHVIIAGVGLILLINAIALAGVAWNRSEPADSRLLLSERELGTSHQYWRAENSGIALRLDYRWAKSSADEFDNVPLGPLSAAKMAELGFTVPQTLDDETVRRFRRQLDRDGFLVLELNGPLYREILQEAELRVQQSTQDLATLPDNKELQEQRQAAVENLQHEQVRSSRLIVADAGTDPDVLRARYPDRQQYVILPARISAWGWRSDNRWYIGGSAEVPLADSINLPHRWHGLFESLPLRKPAAGFPHSGGDKLFNAEVHFGKRFEPWVVQLQAGQP